MDDSAKKETNFEHLYQELSNLPENVVGEIYGLENNRWILSKTFGQSDQVKALPFEEIEFDLADLWSGLSMPPTSTNPLKHVFAADTGKSSRL
jgi:hypothetical protein